MTIFPNEAGHPPRIMLLGGTSEIGLAILAALGAPADAEVILAGRDEQRLAAAGKELPYRVRTVPYDAITTERHPAFVDAVFADGHADIAAGTFQHINGAGNLCGLDLDLAEVLFLSGQGGSGGEQQTEQDGLQAHARELHGCVRRRMLTREPRAPSTAPLKLVRGGVRECARMTVHLGSPGAGAHRRGPL